ncbi:glutamate--cysteine ligase [Oceanibacterium hippocampi]|uniref:Glutamate--cysteine ligase n=1 Tax=Oceanibacterium hippocampi TaxID=745714 RepID=A0A1Y5S7D5_9PROT|nr:glutamate--cysteine ligase [Oceanibacterium hippocampi]SLN33198.1 Glutamate--cysteine ligase GshA [Oceanibacterium hippocampi]
MSGPASGAKTPIESEAQLVAFLESGCKPVTAWRIGTEHEKFAFDVKTLRALPYDGPNGIRAILNGMTRFGWEPVFEGENVIALTMDGASVSLEPGGQFELSGAPLETVHQTCSEVNTHLAQVREVGDELGIGFLGVGFQPKWSRDETPIMPKGRYNIMRAYMPKRGNLGLDMMLRSCTVQVNLDYGSEADMVKKFRTSLALQPVATAIFANSPFVDGKPSGYMSYRSHIWTDTDPDRTGMLPFVFEDGFDFERYVQYALDVPMYFVYRDGTYLDASGQSFRDFLAGRLPALPGEKPTLVDWDNHLTTIFPEVRLKRFLEMRGADGGPWRRLCALPALWTGIFYDQTALDAAWDLVRDWSAEERQRVRDEVPRHALMTPLADGRKLLDVAKQMLEISRDGLKRRARMNFTGEDEGVFLDALFQIVWEGRCPAREMLARYEGPWQKSVDPIFREYAF